LLEEQAMDNETPKITQAMIDAYDEYTHLTLDRRRFMEKLTQLAGSGAAAAAIAPLIGASSAKADIIPANDDRVTTEDVDEGLLRETQECLRHARRRPRHP
jgi:carboxymethylenebutenolidase